MPSPISICHISRTKYTRTHRKCVEHRGMWSGTPDDQFPDRRSERLRHCRERMHYIQLNHIIEKPKIVNAAVEENLKKAEIKFLMVLKILIHKTSVAPKLLQLKNWLWDNQKEWATEKVLPVLTERFGLLSAGDESVILQELKKPVVDASHFVHPGSTKMLGENNKF